MLNHVNLKYSLALTTQKFKEKMKTSVLSADKNSTSSDTQLSIIPLLSKGARSQMRFSSTFQGTLLIPYFPPIVCTLNPERRCLYLDPPPPFNPLRPTVREGL